MTPDVLSQIAAPIITGICTIAAIIMASRLTVYRIQQLEKKVEKHNCLVERMVAVEQSAKAAHHRLDKMEE